MRLIRRPTNDAERERALVELGRALNDMGIAPGEQFAVIAPPDKDAPGGARRTDPGTSQLAAQRVAPRTGSARAVALHELDLMGAVGATGRELVGLTGIDGIWKRVSELHREGFIEPRGDTRTDPTTKEEGKVFVLTDAGREFCQSRKEQ